MKYFEDNIEDIIGYFFKDNVCVTERGELTVYDKDLLSDLDPNTLDFSIDGIKEVLLSEIKEIKPDLPKLTEFDRQYLQFCLECGYKYIARDKGDFLYVYDIIPEYDKEDEMFDSAGEYRECLKQVVSELKCGECYKIAKLLNEEVEE